MEPGKRPGDPLPGADTALSAPQNQANPRARKLGVHSFRVSPEAKHLPPNDLPVRLHVLFPTGAVATLRYLFA